MTDGKLPLFDGDEGRLRKDAGQATVLIHTGHAWRTAARRCLRGLAEIQRELTSDDLRRVAAASGVPDPHHPNAWGAVFTEGARRGWIEDTGRRTRTRIRKGNARKVTVWRSLLVADGGGDRGR